MSVFEDHVYWSTQEKGEVFRQEKFGQGDKIRLLTAGPWLTQVSVYQQQRYNTIASKLHTLSHVHKVCMQGLFVYSVQSLFICIHFISV